MREARGSNGSRRGEAPMQQQTSCPCQDIEALVEKVYFWGLVPFKIKQELKRYRKRRKHKRTQLVREEVAEALWEIIEEHPEYYLDEIANAY